MTNYWQMKKSELIAQIQVLEAQLKKAGVYAAKPKPVKTAKPPVADDVTADLDVELRKLAQFTKKKLIPLLPNDGHTESFLNKLRLEELLVFEALCNAYLFNADNQRGLTAFEAVDVCSVNYQLLTGKPISEDELPAILTAIKRELRAHKLWNIRVISSNDDRHKLVF